VSHEYETTEATRFWIAHDGAAVVHYGEEAIGAHVATGQPILEKFGSRVDWAARLLVLGIAEVP
jgi:hypothetical protein